MARVQDPSRLEKCDEIRVKSQFYNQVQLIKQCYPGDAKLVAWPYSTLTMHYVTIAVYGEFCKVEQANG